MTELQQQTILSMYNKRRPMSHIGKAVGMSPKNVEKWLKNNGFWTGHRYMLNFFDEFFFDQINTEEKAYWLGFIYADGYVNKTNNEIGIEIKSSDKNHLEKFKNDIQAEKEVKIYKKKSTFGEQENARITLCSAHIHNILLNYFSSTNKTFEGTFPIEQVPKHLCHHFIRGFFDGDGSISLTKRVNLDGFNISFIGQKRTLEIIENLSGFSWTWAQRYPEKHTDNYQIFCGQVNDCLSFLSYMYTDAHVFLERKYEKYQKILENREFYKAKARV